MYVTGKFLRYAVYEMSLQECYLDVYTPILLFLILVICPFHSHGHALELLLHYIIQTNFKPCTIWFEHMIKFECPDLYLS